MLRVAQGEVGIYILVELAPVATLKTQEACEGNHGGIVGGEAGWTGEEFQAVPRAGFSKGASQCVVTTHSAGEGDQAASTPVRRAEGLVDEDIDNGLLKGRAEVWNLPRQITGLWQGVTHGGLQSREGEVEFAWYGAWKIVGGGISLEGAPLDFWSAGIGKSHKAGHLVKGFACGVIESTAEELVVPDGPGMNEHGVSSGDDESEVRGDAGR